MRANQPIKQTKWSNQHSFSLLHSHNTLTISGAHNVTSDKLALRGSMYQKLKMTIQKSIDGTYHVIPTLMT